MSRKWGLLAVALIAACSGESQRPDTDPSTGGSSGDDGNGGSAGSDEPTGGAPEGGSDGEGGSNGGTGGVAGGVPGPEGYRDVLDTTLSVDLETLRAVATLTLAPSTESGATFQNRTLTIESVRIADEEVSFGAGSGPYELDVAVPASTDPVEVTFEYSFDISSDRRGVTPSFAYTWPFHCGEVFPCNAHPSDGSTFHLTVSGASSSAVYPAEIPGDAPAYMAAWAVGDYTRLDLGTTTAGTQVAAWYLPGGLADVQAGTAELRAAFDWMEQNIGPYRFGSEVGSVAVDWTDGTGGMEHHPYWHMDLDSMTDPSNHVHEAAHGWFGNGVRLRCWEDFVLSEGTASYLAARVLEEIAGTSASDPVWAGYEADLGEGRAWFPVDSCDVGFSHSGDILVSGVTGRVTYVKGALFLRAVEERVGRASFDAALAAFYSRFAGEAAGVQDLLDVITEITEYDPAACAEAWLVEEAPPTAMSCP